MAAIGFYDEDMKHFTHTAFNLEIMKMATYYRRKRDIISLTPSFAPEYYTKLYYRKDYNDGNFISNFRTYNNVETGGLAFSDNQYLQLPPEIENLPPDTSIYQTQRRLFETSDMMALTFQSLTKAQHLRLSLDGMTINPQFSRQLNSSFNSKTNLFLHDFAPGQIDGAFETVQNLLKRMKNYGIFHPYVSSKFPVYAENTDSLLQWMSLPTSSQYFTFLYDGLIPNNMLENVYITGDKKKSKLECDITRECNSQDDFYERILPLIHKQIIYFRHTFSRIKFRYDQEYFEKMGWDKTIDLMNCYAVSLMSLRHRDIFEEYLDSDSVYAFCRSLPDEKTKRPHVPTKVDARLSLTKIRIKNYDLFRAFYEARNVELKGGKLEYV